MCPDWLGGLHISRWTSDQFGDIDCDWITDECKWGLMTHHVTCRDASRASVLEAAGIERPRALAIVYQDRARLLHTVHSLREHFLNVRKLLVGFC